MPIESAIASLSLIFNVFKELTLASILPLHRVWSTPCSEHPGNGNERFLKVSGESMLLRVRNWSVCSTHSMHLQTCNGLVTEYSVCMSVCACQHVAIRGITPQLPSTFVSETRSLRVLDLTKQAWLAGQDAQGSSCLWDYRTTQASFSHRFWTQTWVLMLQLSYFPSSKT
jgi:hypothetical protein